MRKRDVVFWIGLVVVATLFLAGIQTLNMQIATVDGNGVHIRGHYYKYYVLENNREEAFIALELPKDLKIKTNYVIYNGTKYPAYADGVVFIPEKATYFQLDGKKYYVHVYNLKPLGAAVSIVMTTILIWIFLSERSTKKALGMLFTGMTLLAPLIIMGHQQLEDTNYLLVGKHTMAIKVTTYTEMTSNGIEKVYKISRRFRSLDMLYIALTEYYADGQKRKIDDLTFYGKFPETFTIAGSQYRVHKEIIPLEFMSKYAIIEFVVGMALIGVSILGLNGAKAPAIVAGAFGFGLGSLITSTYGNVELTGGEKFVVSLTVFMAFMAYTIFLIYKVSNEENQNEVLDT